MYLGPLTSLRALIIFAQYNIRRDQVKRAAGDITLPNVIKALFIGVRRNTASALNAHSLFK